MTAPRRRENDTKRVVKSIQDHQETMAALGRAAASSDDIGSAIYWAKPESVRKAGSASSKVDKQRAKGLLTDKEAGTEKLEIAVREGRVY